MSWKARFYYLYDSSFFFWTGEVTPLGFIEFIVNSFWVLNRHDFQASMTFPNMQLCRKSIRFLLRSNFECSMFKFMKTIKAPNSRKKGRIFMMVTKETGRKRFVCWLLSLFSLLNANIYLNVLSFVNKGEAISITPFPCSNRMKPWSFQIDGQDIEWQ